MTLEQAIATVIDLVPTRRSMQHSRTFTSVEALTRACDPAAIGVMGAAQNRAATRRCATLGEWQATPEGIKAELAEFEAAGWQCNVCGGRACALPA